MFIATKSADENFYIYQAVRECARKYIVETFLQERCRDDDDNDDDDDILSAWFFVRWMEVYV